MLAGGGLVRETHAIGRKDAGEGMDEDARHAQIVRHEAGMLAAGAAKALQGEGGDILPAFQRCPLDRGGHVGDGDPQEALGRLMRGPPVCQLKGETLELFAHDVGVQRLVAAGTEDGGEVPRRNLAAHDIGVGHRQRAAAAIGGRAGIGAGAVRTDPEADAVVVKDGAAAGRHRVDGHHGHAHLDARDLGVEGALKSAGVEGHVGGRAAHVEGDDPLFSRSLGRAGCADHAARRTGEDGVLALEFRRRDEAAAGLHEVERGVVELPRNPIDVAAKHGREIGVDDRRAPARHQTHQGTDGVTGRDLGEPGLTGQGCKALLGGWMLPGVDQGDGDGLIAFRQTGAEHGGRRLLIERLEGLAIDRNPPPDLFHSLVKRRGKADVEVEQPRPCLVADAQQVAEAAVDQQKGAGALAFEQGVGGDRGAHLDVVDEVSRKGRIEGKAQGRTHTRRGGVIVALGVFAEHLGGGQHAFRAAGDDVGEGAAAVDPETPAAHAPSPCPAVSARRAKVASQCWPI
ncbi:hypothetical protein D3C72_755140 [compost metagenome]